MSLRSTLPAHAPNRNGRSGAPTARLTALLFVLLLLATACGPRFDREALTISSGELGGQVDQGGGFAAPATDGGFVDPGTSTDGGTTDGGTTDDGTTDGGVVTDGGATTDGGTTSGGTDTGTSSGGTTSGGTDTGTSSGGTTSGGTDTGTSSGGTSSGGTSSGGTTTAPPPADKGPTPGVTDNSIRIGYLLPLTGAAPIPVGFDDGVRVYWNFLNANGGINGRNVEIIIYDTESTTSNAIAQARKAVQQDKVFTLLSLDRLEVQDALAKFLEQVGMPHVMVQSPANPPSSWKNTFVGSVDHAVQGAGIAQFMAEVIKKPKVAFVREQTNALKPGTDAFEKRAAALGLEVVAKLTTDPSNNDQSGTVNALVASGAEVVWLYMAPTVAANIVSSAGARTYQPVWFANNISWNFELMHGVTANFLNGSYAFSSWVPLNDKRAQKYKDEYRRQISDPSKSPDDIGLVGWGAGEVISDVLGAAGKDLGWNSFRSALRNFKKGGNVWTPLDFTNGFVGTNVVKVYKSNGSQWSLFQDDRPLR